MEPYNVRTLKLKTYQIVNYKFVEWLQKKRASSKWRTVQPFPLLMADCFFYNLDTKFRCLRINPVFR